MEVLAWWSSVAFCASFIVVVVIVVVVVAYLHSFVRYGVST